MISVLTDDGKYEIVMQRYIENAERCPLKAKQRIKEE